MNKLYRNPGAWFSLVMLGGMTYLFFRNFPVFASILYGIFFLWIFFIKIRSSWRLKKRGYRVRWSGRDSFFYEELNHGEVRNFKLYGEIMEPGFRHVYFPSSDTWRQTLPDWAKDRRSEIIDRIVGDLGTKKFKYYDGP